MPQWFGLLTVMYLKWTNEEVLLSSNHLINIICIWQGLETVCTCNCIVLIKTINTNTVCKHIWRDNLHNMTHHTAHCEFVRCKEKVSFFRVDSMNPRVTLQQSCDWKEISDVPVKSTRGSGSSLPQYQMWSSLWNI